MCLEDKHYIQISSPLVHYYAFKTILSTRILNFDYKTRFLKVLCLPDFATQTFAQKTMKREKCGSFSGVIFFSGVTTRYNLEDKIVGFNRIL